MAIPTFSFGSYASDLVSPNRVLVPTRLTAADRPVAERYQSEIDAYNTALDKYKQDVEAYNAALETYNAGPRDKEFTMATPTAPANLGYTTEDVQAFEADAASRAAAQQAARQNALNIIRNPEGFSQQYGIGSLAFGDGGVAPGGIGSLQSRVDLGDGDPEIEREPFMVGGYELRPNAYIEYGSGGSEEPVRMSDEETGVVRESYREGFGNIGLDVTTPGQHKFGGSASGSYTRGKVELPYGEVIRYGEGVTPERYNAYYETPGGTRLSGMYRESNPDQQRAFEIMLQKRFATDDLIDRISRLFKK